MNPAYFENNNDGADAYMLSTALENSDGDPVVFIKNNQVMLAVESNPATMADLENYGGAMLKTTTELYSENGNSSDFKQLSQLITVDNDVSDE